MRYLYFVLILVVFSSCSNEIDLYADWENIPVVFGLVEADGTDQYLRVERVFQGEDGNAFDAAQNIDSIYYSNASVFVTNESTGASALLEKTEVSSTLNLDRDPGLFVREPNFLYKLDADDLFYQAGDVLTLELFENGVDVPFSVAQTNILQPVEYIPNSSGIISFRPGKPTSFNFEFGPNSKLFDLILYLNITEFDSADESITEKSIKWVVARGINIPSEVTSFYTYSIQGDGFYAALLDNLEVVPTVTRFFGEISVEFIAAGEELKLFNEIAQVNTGITSAQEIPVYSNLSNGLGIFSSKSTSRVDELTLSEVALDSLRNSELTESLNFN